MQIKKELHTGPKKLFYLLLVLTILYLSVSDCVFAQNLVQNPNINGNLNNWVAGVSTYDAALDATGVPGSGSAQHIFNYSGGGSASTLAIYQCITTFVPGNTYNFGGKVYIPSSQIRQGNGAIHISWFTGSDCTTGLISYSTLWTYSSDPTDTWISLDSSPILIPLNAGSIWFAAHHSIDNNGSHQANFDDLYLDESPEVSSIPTLTEWGMIIFVVFAGLGAIYFIRRQKTSKS